MQGDRCRHGTLYLPQTLFERRRNASTRDGGLCLFENTVCRHAQTGWISDVMNGFDTCFLRQATFKSNIEVRCINTNKNIWLSVCQNALSDWRHPSCMTARPTISNVTPITAVLSIVPARSLQLRAFRFGNTNKAGVKQLCSFQERIKNRPSDIIARRFLRRSG